MVTSFRDAPLAKRQAEAAAIRQKYPQRLPVICERAANASADVPDIDKHKFLVPPELTVGQFVYVIRKRIQLGPAQALFLFVRDPRGVNPFGGGGFATIPPTSELMQNMHDRYRDDDGFLYVTYSGENTFGAA